MPYTLQEALKNGFPFWKRPGWGWEYLDITTMEIVKGGSATTLSSRTLTEEDICAKDWIMVPIGG